MRHRWPALLFVAVVVVLALPDLVGLDRFTPLAQLVALRPYLLGGLALLAAALLVLARWVRGAAVAAAGVTAVLLVAAAMVVPRAMPTPAPEGGRTLTVAAFNTYSGGADVPAVAALIREERPDLVSLVEASTTFRAKLAPLVEPLGYHLVTAVGEPTGDLGGVTAVVADHLGAVRASTYTATPFPRVELEGGGLGDLRFVAFHTLAPRRGDVAQWLSDVSLVAQWCAGPQPAIVAGDFNATLDHSVFRSAIAGCGDAAAQRGQGLTPTWPTWLPDWLGPQIDHVLATDGIVAEWFAVRDVRGSDHRAVLTRLRIPDGVLPPGAGSRGRRSPRGGCGSRSPRPGRRRGSRAR
ncbi:endonuclease/exonuclease/phosphatase family protein [Pseudonocardia zijingensis]|uniref:Endonuclease/exonuclease/phosphatase domain-containing protein n=1 Tax=Pseudonocardia zijingensis TaxID=153376 RepID=A0ABN1PPI0_9PSEU